MADDELETKDELRTRTPSISSRHQNPKLASSFFKSFRKYKSRNPPDLTVMGEAGMEPELMNKLGKLNFSTQIEAFYTAYSKVCSILCIGTAELTRSSI